MMARHCGTATVLVAACAAGAGLSGCGAGAIGQPERARQGVAAVVLDARGHALADVRADGAVVTATADGRGGWYVTGDFRHIGGLRRRGLAHLTAAGVVDPVWRARLGRPVSKQSIGVLLAAGYGRVYLFGVFRINGVRRRGGAAVDARTGALDGHWKPRDPFLPTALAVAPGRVLLARGPDVVAFRPRSGRRLRRFHVRTHVPGKGFGVDALAVHGRRVYVGGYMDRVNGVRRIGVARVALRTGRLVRRWRPPPLNDRGPCRCNRAANELVATRRRLFAVGTFNHVGRVPAPGGLAAFGARTGRLTRFRAARPGRYLRSPGGYGSAAIVGRRLFVAGLFGSAHAHSFVILDAVTGRRLPSWHPARRRANPLDVTASGARVLVTGERLGP